MDLGGVAIYIYIYNALVARHVLLDLSCRVAFGPSHPASTQTNPRAAERCQPNVLAGASLLLAARDLQLQLPPGSPKRPSPKRPTGANGGTRPVFRRGAESQKKRDVFLGFHIFVEVNADL